MFVCLFVCFGQARGVRLEECAKPTSDDEEEDDDVVTKMNRSSLASSESKVRLDEAGVLHWPVLFIYPEHGQSDLISSFNENNR